jgi:uncharacterized protein YbjT (DUF2867 family)
MTVLVTGATGRFGAICERLIERGHQVRAMTRTPTSPAADRLRELGVDVVPGDFDDPRGLESAMGGVDSVFATGTLHKAGIDGERRHGRNIAEAARAAGVGHLTYVSGAGAAPATGVPVFDVKAEVERRIRALGGPTTIIAPVYLMENLFNPWNMAALERGRLPSYLRADRLLQQVPVVDVIGFAVLALEQPERFTGPRVEIASDELTAREMADTISRIAGRAYVVAETSPAELGPGLSTLFEWLQRTGHDVDIPELRRRHPDVGWHTFEEWAGSALDRVLYSPFGKL